MLVGGAPGVPDLDGGAVGALVAGRLQDLAGGDVGEGVGAVAVPGGLPVLVGAAVVVPDQQLRTVGGLAGRIVQDPAAGDVGEGVGAVAVLAGPPLLVGGAAAGVPHLERGAVAVLSRGLVEDASGGAHRGERVDGAGGDVLAWRAAAGTGQGGEDGVVGGLLVAVAVEQQRVLAGAPGVAVADAPHGDARAAGDVEAVPGGVGVRVGGGLGEVEFGELDVHAERGEVGQGGLEAGRRAAGAEVALEADAVDGHAAGLEVLDHVVDALGLGVGPVLDVVVVVAELGRGVGVPGGAEGLLDEAVAQHVLEHGAAVPAAAVVGERLVDHVPGVDLALVVGHLLGDVVVHHAAQGVGVADGADPGGQLGVPDQGVAAHLLAVRGGVADDRVGGGEVE